MKTWESFPLIAKADWQRVEAADFPFADYDYLAALETSGAAVPATGWQPEHLTAWHNETLLGALPLYAKNHSYGEYIFDWAWAQAFDRHRVPYYPKLSSAIPFTPATGPKLLFSPNVDREAVAAALLTETKRKAESFSSLHFLFLSPEEVPYFEREGFLIRHSFQYHWRNQNYRTFDEFLNRLKPRKRKAIVKERSELAAQGLSIEMLKGDEITPEHAEIFYQCYLSTIQKMGAIAYLNLAFYQNIFVTMRDRLVLILAKNKELPIAAALFYEKGKTLYGRYWGALEEVKHLHFELCYYRAIEYAIDRGLTLFEAGAQGEHKLARGFLPEITFSAHWIRHDGFRAAITNFVDEERQAIQNYLSGVSSPYADLPLGP